MKAMRKFCSVVLCASLMCTVIAGCSSDEAAETNANAGEDAAVEEESEDGLYYGYFKIQDMPDGGKEFTIDFASCSSVQEVRENTVGELIIPEGVTSINAMLFEGFPNITSVTVPSTVTELPARCFMNCASLEEVILPDTLEVLNGYTFYDSPALETIILPSSLRVIGMADFGWGTNAPDVRNIYFSDGIELEDYTYTKFDLVYTAMPRSWAVDNVYIVEGSWIDQHFEELYADDTNGSSEMPDRQYWDGVNP